MKPSGSYPHLLTWLKRTGTVNATNGQVVETFASNGTLWGEVREERGRRESDYGAQQTGADATVRVRNRPSLSPLDRLTYDSTTWFIDSLSYDREDDEVVCICFKFDDLVTP